MYFKSNLGIIVLFFANFTHSAHILFYHQIASYSHQVATFPLAQALAAKGHQITYLTPWPKRDFPPFNSSIEFLIPSEFQATTKAFVEVDFDIKYRIEKKFPLLVHQWFPHALATCEQILGSSELREWMERTKKLDLVILDNCFSECALGIAHKYAAKYVVFNTIVFMGHEYDTYGILPETSAIPEYELNPFRTPITFWNRVVNTLIPIHFRWAQYSYLKEIDGMVRKFVKDPNMPFIDDLARNVSLVLYPGDVVTDMPRSLPPHVVNVGGLHCHVKTIADQLPEKMLQFVEDPSSDGFLYVSFGSVVEPSKLPATLQKMFLDAFESFPKLKFLWRWGGPEPKNVPENVMLSNWFPQMDVLAHKSIRGFITQAGRPSLNEALCNAVPVIMFPVLGDQDWNANRMEDNGAGIKMEFAEVTKDDLIKNIQKLAYESRFKNRMIELNQILLDQPTSALNKAVWWVEYVLRRDTSHLKPAGFHQWWYERRLLDVWAFIFLVIMAVVYLIITTIIVFTKKIVNRNSANSKAKKKSE